MIFSFLCILGQTIVYMLLHTEQVIQFFESSWLGFNGIEHYLFIDVSNYSLNTLIISQFTLQTACMS